MSSCTCDPRTASSSVLRSARPASLAYAARSEPFAARLGAGSLNVISMGFACILLGIIWLLYNGYDVFMTSDLAKTAEKKPKPKPAAPQEP